MDAFLSWVVSNAVFAGLLAAAAFLISRSFRNPHLAHGLWLLVLIKLVTPPIFVLETTWFQKPEPLPAEPALPAAMEPVPNVATDLQFAEPDVEVVSSLPADDVPDFIIEESLAPALPTEPPPVSVSKRIGWKRGLLLAWSLGTVFCAVLIVSRSRQFRKLLALSLPAEEDLQNEVLRWSRRLRMKRCPSVFLIEARIPPLVWGLFRQPRILLPRQLFEELTDEERQTVLVHELAHIRRGDHLFRWIEVGVVVLFWWNPVAWWASREMRRAEEECCDALVIWTLPGARQCYGQALCKTIEFLVETHLPIPQIAGGAFGARPLKRRIEMILRENVSHRMSWKAWSAMLLVAAVALPVVAQNTPPEEPAASQEPDTQSTQTPLALPPAQPRSSNRGVLPPATTPNSEPKAQNAQGENVDGFPKPAGHIISDSAHLKPSSDVQISSLQAGMVLKVHVTEGQAVKEGDLLVELRNTETELRYQEALGELKVQQEKVKNAQLAVKLAQATLPAASDKQKHAERMKEKGYISNTAYQAANGALAQAEIFLRTAESEEKAAALTLANLQKREKLAARLVQELSLKAPADGIVLNIFPKAGELVRANDPVARVVSLSPMIAEAHVRNPEGLLNREVVVQVPSLAGQVPLNKVKPRTFPAKVTFVSPIVDSVTGMTTIRCVFKNLGPKGEILARPGQTADIILPAKE